MHDEFRLLVVMFIYLLLAFIFVALLPFESIQTGKDPFFIVGQYFLKNLLQIDSPAVIEWIPRIMTYIIFFIILGDNFDNHYRQPHPSSNVTR